MVSGTVCGGSIPLRRTKKKSTLSICLGRDFLCTDIIDRFYIPLYSLLPKHMLKLISATTAVGVALLGGLCGSPIARIHILMEIYKKEGGADEYS